MRAYRFALRPSWLALHVFVLASMVTMILLGRWQLHVSEAKHFSLQNFGYSIQWWVFSGFAAALWWRVLRDRVRRDRQAAGLEPAEPGPPDREIVAYRRYVMPSTSSEPADPVHSAYNDYLAELAAHDAHVSGASASPIESSER